MQEQQADYEASIFMTDLILQTPLAQNDPINLSFEIARLETSLVERQIELTSLQEELREFRTRYTEIVGSLLAELADIEQAVKKAEARLLGLDPEEVDEQQSASAHFGEALPEFPAKQSLRKLFWSIAKLFHPDHANDAREAERRHTIMAEASRAYHAGDAERLTTMLGDDELQSYCARSAHEATEENDPVSRLLNLKEELRTAEFGIKRIEQDALYKLKLSVEKDATRGRDALAEMAARIKKQIAQAHLKLEQLT